jgi:uncharacterized protein DUF3310
MAGTAPEPEFTADDGTVRKAHYGTGKQPWDIIVESYWGAQFAAGNVLKYIRRAPNKNGDDDVRKARWYFQRLIEMSMHKDPLERDRVRVVYAHLCNLLTTEEIITLSPVKES